ncbi:MAG: 50S ribosomal protein L10 [Nanoarchaeota archaeon]
MAEAKPKTAQAPKTAQKAEVKAAPVKTDVKGGHPKAHVAQYKKDQVKQLVQLFKSYPIIGVLNMEGLPASQANVIRQKLRSQVAMTMAKKRIIHLAIEQVKADKPGIEKIEQEFKGMPGLLFTKENPFAIFKLIKKSKSPAAAKAGQKAPKDLMVKAGATPFAPGPVISELAGLGIKSKVDNGKIAIVSDTVVAKEGAVISDKLASMLMRLGITPMEIGLDLVALYEKGFIFNKSVLDIDEDALIADVTNAARWANNLSVETAFVTKDNRELLIQKAFREAKAISLESAFLTEATKNEILACADAQAKSVKSEANL